MKGSLIIVGFFVLGIIAGLCDVVPASFLDSDVSYIALRSKKIRTRNPKRRRKTKMTNLT